MTILTRPESDDDEPFLWSLILETIAEQSMAALWPEAIRQNLLEMQYRARLNSIRGNYTQGESVVVVVDGKSAGWLFGGT